MSSQALLQQAINAAKNQNWDEAATINQALLEINSQDIGALNRLGIAYSQLNKMSDAKKAFQAVLEIDKFNAIAKKNIGKLKNNQVPTTPLFSKQDFIEEPGKTRTVELHRLAGKNVLDSLAVGQECQLKCKNRYISVETQTGVYIGAIPEDISFRLAKLIETGNIYYCCIRSFSSSHASVYIKELSRSETNQYVSSFPTSKSTGGGFSDIDEELMLEDDLPVEAVETEGEGEIGKPGFEDLDNDSREV